MSYEKIIEAMLLQDEIDEANSVREDIRSDELHERRMRTDLEYFLEHSEFPELKELLNQHNREIIALIIKMKEEKQDENLSCV